MKVGLFLCTQYPEEGAMRVGLTVPNQYREGASAAKGFAELLDQVRLVRDLGWDSIWTGQHFLTSGYQMLQMIPFLARASAEAGGMTVGVGILLVALHNPVEAAETIATLDVICGGRLIFGVGLGYRDEEYDAFAIPRGQRVARFESHLSLIRRLWTEDRVDFEGPDCILRGARMNLRPLQKPHPPIWVAANNDPAVRRAARLGDTWFINPHANYDTIRAQIALFREERKRVGKPMPEVLPMIKELYVARDRKTALRECGPYLGEKYKVYAQWGQDKALPGEESFDRPFEELAGGRFILGSPKECLEQLRPYVEELGVNYLVFRMQWPGMPQKLVEKNIKLAHEALVPELRKL